jgi:hypothetical protein
LSNHEGNGPQMPPPPPPPGVQAWGQPYSTVSATAATFHHHQHAPSNAHYFHTNTAQTRNLIGHLPPPPPSNGVPQGALTESNGSGLYDWKSSPHSARHPSAVIASGPNNAVSSFRRLPPPISSHIIHENGIESDEEDSEGEDVLGAGPGDDSPGTVRHMGEF